jgi:hypothetical protein
MMVAQWEGCYRYLTMSFLRKDVNVPATFFTFSQVWGESDNERPLSLVQFDKGSE